MYLCGRSTERPYSGDVWGILRIIIILKKCGEEDGTFGEGVRHRGKPTITDMRKNIYSKGWTKVAAALAAAAVTLGASARQPGKGYRGFLDWSNDVRSENTGLDGGNETLYYTGFSTSHGYQFNPWVYVGAGFGIEKCTRYDLHLFPVFVHGRTDLQFGRFTPFGEIRLGYNLTDDGGVYFAPNIGYRFNWGRKMGVNVGVGVTLQGIKTHIYELSSKPGEYWYLEEKGTRHDCRACFSFRVGIDF